MKIYFTGDELNFTWQGCDLPHILWVQKCWMSKHQLQGLHIHWNGNWFYWCVS